MKKNKNNLCQRNFGKIVNDLLIKSFEDVVNVDFTAEIEKEFDNIAEGKEEWKKAIREFYRTFSVELEKAQKELETVELVEEVSDVKCEKCRKNDGI